MEDGVPIVVDGKIVSEIGVSGVQSKDDAQIAQDVHLVLNLRTAKALGINGPTPPCGCRRSD